MFVPRECDLDRRRGASVAAVVVLGLHLFVFGPLLLGAPGTAGSALHSAPTVHTAAALVFTGLVPQGSPSPPIIVSISRQALEASTREFRQRQFLGLGDPPQLEFPREALLESPPAAPPIVRRIGEITARIQDAWVLPRSTGADDFHCRVRIRQDATGVLNDVDVQQCDVDAELRASLLKAIRAAAPLPSRDDTHDATWDLTLQFTSLARSFPSRRTRVEPSASMP